MWVLRYVVIRVVLSFAINSLRKSYSLFFHLFFLLCGFLLALSSPLGWYVVIPGHNNCISVGDGLSLLLSLFKAFV